MPIDPRATVGWYIELSWQQWYHPRLQGWTKSMRKSDILMSALLQASAGEAIKATHLISIIGAPDWIEGTTWKGIMYYQMHRRADLAAETHHVVFEVVGGRLTHNCGTNLLMNFQPCSGRRKP